MAIPHRPLAAIDWHRARARCMREAMRYTRSATEAEDVVQEALLRAWRQHGSLRDPSRSMPWLLQITRNEALRALDRPGRTREVPSEEVGERPAADTWTELAGLRVDVQRALRTLPEPDRALVDLRYVDDMTQSGVADAMKIPLGTCKVRLHRLRKRLHVLLAEEVPS